ncbi:MAG: type II toxin-antitoxin system Phd/YefM family antitoxin [Chloroflexota bacterium]|nr:type II toxin-antitoxin system Phd/YefM family antitoxin [Chloroflexota bacterium]
MTQTMNVSQARQEWSEVINKVFRKETRVLVEKSGIPVVAIVSPEDLERLKQYDAEEARSWAVLDKIRERNGDQDPDQVLQDVTNVVEAVRQERYDREHAEGRR